MSASVVIVGAGPCGLALASQLLRRGKSVRVLDAKPSPHGGSRAILLWSPAQDVLRDVGVLEEARQRAFIPQALNYLGGRRRLARIGLDTSRSLIALPQGVTESLLEESLHHFGGKVERDVRVTALRQDAESAVLDVEDASGDRSRIETSWVIGADGVNSTVREQLGTAFTGSRLPTTFLLAEGTVRGADRLTDISYRLTSRGLLLVAPLGNGTVRVASNVPGGTKPTPDLVQRLLDERCPDGLRIEDITTLETFTSDERSATSLRTGRCFLVGDAGHTHSAFGGQGLSLGLQDVRNLAWKLAGVIEGRLPSDILDTYDPERQAAIQHITRLTGVLVRVAVAKPPRTLLRDLVIRGLEKAGALRRWYVPLLEGQRIRYPATPNGCSPNAGLPVPEWARALPDSTRFRLITTRSGHSAPASEVADRHPELVVHHHVPGGSRELLLVRPDGYVSHQGGLSELRAVDEYLDRLEAGSG